MITILNSKPMKKTAFLLSLCALTYLTSCTNKKKEETEIAEYTVTNPVIKDTTFTKEYIAQIQSLQNVEIRAQEKGYLETLHVDEGQSVKSGQLLFSIMPNLYQADYLKAKADARVAEIEFQNTKTLADKNIVSKSELAMSKAKLDGANADLAMAQTHLSFTKITAPFDGTIDRILFKKGSSIDEGTVLTKISNNKEIYAYFNMSEVEYLDYKARAKNDINNNAGLLLSNGDKFNHQGRIETIESEFDNETGNIAFRAKFPNSELLLKNGETGKVQLTVPLKNALMIPQKATFEIQDKIYVYVMDKDNVVHSRNIVVKQRLSNVYIIQSGLSANDKILVDGIQTVKEDEKIKPKVVSANEIFNTLELIKQ
ncbi:efflux RND transporter periplasmic adaptor subunit [Flavobacterium sp. SUN052]|uniref:efflux RND transporter periplasmic adaptor subunit n=1 Tax=Flavobacterium sp. SUN052 TaxID=3002441 RepID=UPI002DB6988D|nr:efflux RND transporter periplasmic adaptor subunit [Flavobacterium sp. SUN052]MEC4003339.1 efflux RND transporter periplasmic adaptor subunit [Flavobacterium sp. SUN052]